MKPSLLTKNQARYTNRLKSDRCAKQAAAAFPKVMKAIEGIRPEAARRALKAAGHLIR